MNIIDKLIKSNEAPVLFIGTGISKRYINNFPSWTELLLLLWRKLNRPDAEFYEKMLQVKDDCKNSGENSDGLVFKTNTKMASYLMYEFNSSFNHGNISVDNLTPKSAYTNNIDPFKKEISNIFKSLTFMDSAEHEIEVFKQLLLKSRAVITTNYDKALEKIMNNEYKTYTRQSDLFLFQDDCGSLYKVHGDVSEPNEIIITEQDYERFSENSILISSKLISLLMESPIIFLGYSLTDQNVLAILNKFARSLRPEQKGLLADRLIYIDYKKGEQELKEYKKESHEIGAQFTVIETDNYQLLYKKLLEIEQGLPVSQVRKFKDKIKELIIEHGKKGTLKKLLLSPYELDENKVSDNNIVIAIGNNKMIFNIPDRLDYLKAYVNNIETLDFNVALKFIAMQAKKTRIPILKYTKDIDFSNPSLGILRPEEIEKIMQRVNDDSVLEKALNSIPSTCRIKKDSLKDIIDLNLYYYKELDVISYNAKHLPKNDIESYIKNQLSSITYEQWKKNMSFISRLIVIWDYLYNG